MTRVEYVTFSLTVFNYNSQLDYVNPEARQCSGFTYEGNYAGIGKVVD